MPVDDAAFHYTNSTRVLRAQFDAESQGRTALLAAIDTTAERIVELAVSTVAEMTAAVVAVVAAVGTAAMVAAAAALYWVVSA